MPSRIDFMRAKLNATKHSLERKSAEIKDGRVSVQMAEQFNHLLAEISSQYPEIVQHLPKPIVTHAKRGMLIHLLTPVSFLELEILLDQTLAALDVVLQDGTSTS